MIGLWHVSCNSSHNTYCSQWLLALLVVRASFIAGSFLIAGFMRKSFVHSWKNILLTELSGKDFTDLPPGFNYLQDVLLWAYVASPCQCNCHSKRETVGELCVWKLWAEVSGKDLCPVYLWVKGNKRVMCPWFAPNGNFVDLEKCCLIALHQAIALMLNYFTSYEDKTLIL